MRLIEVVGGRCVADWPVIVSVDFICGLGFSMCYIFIPYGDIVMFILYLFQW